MKRILIYLILGSSLLFQSCVKDCTSKCQGELLLRFRYTLNNQFVNLFGEEVQRIIIYVFDSNGKYVDSFWEQGNILTNDYIMHVPLPQGVYNIIAYGGDFTTYSVGELNAAKALNTTLRKGILDINDFRAELKNLIGEEGYLFPLNTPDDLYAGFAVNAPASTLGKKITDIELIKITKKIKVKINGAELTSSPLDIYITATNGRYQFNNNIDSNHGTYKYTPLSYVAQNNYIEANLKMMRLVLGESPMLIIRNRITSEILYKENMIEQTLLTNKYKTQEDFDREDEFVFEITMQQKDKEVNIYVSINGWKIYNINPDI